jgi:hypothetical protein
MEKKVKIDRLISVLDDESIDITEKDRIIEDVCSLGDQSVIKILTDRFYLKNIPLQEKLSLAISLGEIGINAIIPGVIDLLRDSKFEECRPELLHALGYLDAQEHLPLIIDILIDDPALETLLMTDVLVRKYADIIDSSTRSHLLDKLIGAESNFEAVPEDADFGKYHHEYIQRAIDMLQNGSKSVGLSSFFK